MERNMVLMMEHAVKWLTGQVAGWARDDALVRIDKMMLGWLEQSLQKDIDATSYVPHEMKCGMTDKAARAFDRMVGRKPDYVHVEDLTNGPCKLMVTATDCMITVRIRFVIEPKEVITTSHAQPIFEAGSSEVQWVPGTVETEYLAEDEFCIDCEYGYSKHIWENL